MASQPAPTNAFGSPATGTPDDGPYRLPRTVEPTTYRLVLVPNLTTASFRGSVEIDVVVHEPVSEIVLNAAELEIAEATVLPSASDPLVPQVSLDDGAERVTLALPGPIAPGDATIRLSFTGVLNDKLRGFYRSTFTDHTGASRTIATTQMESTDARRAFPCWDEPDRKATFEITLVVEEDMAAFSNSPVASERPADPTVYGEDGKTRREVRFAPTMKMSTYLVAFVVGPLEATDPVDVGGVPVRVVHVPGKAHLTGYALEVAAHALEYYTGYFAIPYPAQKLDLVAIPDFAFGAMENLGCVTFRETALLVDRQAAARTELERIADVVHHEIAHMWFGDLVTMGWWEGIWLNEAFATFMEILATDDFRPAWHRWVSFGLERERALTVDGLHATRPIEYPVGSPEEADGMFDVLTYEKGGSVLRMLEQYLGPSVFRDGVRRYLETHAYGNTVTADLWDALEAVSGEPVRAVADTWILQGGNPLVSVGEDVVSQQPFSFLPAEAGETSAIGSHWLVPLLVRSLDDASHDGDRVHRLLLADEPVALPVARPEAGVEVMNAGGWGAYRVGYDAGHLAALGERLEAMEPLERFNLISDTWALTLAGRLDLAQLLSLASHIPDDESEPGIFAVVAGALGLCDRIVADAERPQVQAAVRALLGPRAVSLGTTGAEPGVRAEAARRFDLSRQGGPAIDPDLEATVLRVVADQCRPRDFDAMLERYRHPANPQEEQRYLMVLATFPDVELSLRAFELARTEVRTQNAPYLVGALFANRVGGPAVWSRVEAEWDGLLARFPENSHSRMLDGVRWLCRDRELATGVRRFLDDHPVRTGQRSVVQALEQLEINVRFGERQRDHGRLADALGAVAGH